MGPLQNFATEFQPLETPDQLIELTDSRTGARYCECHIKGSTIVSLGTTDVPLDPEEQSDYRANRDIVLNSSAFRTMKDDAKQKRSFSNIVAEYTKEFDGEHPLKIIGGQHRFEAIREALGAPLRMATGADTGAEKILLTNRECFTHPVGDDLLDGSQKVAGGALYGRRNAFLYQGSIQNIPTRGLEECLRAVFQDSLNPRYA